MWNRRGKHLLQGLKMINRPSFLHGTKPKPKTAIVMLNMGGPRKMEGVRDFLRQILTDRDIIQFPFLQEQIGTLIADWRAEEVRKKYMLMGGSSPIYYWTELQGRMLCELLDKVCPESAPHRHYVGFRYCEPFIKDAMIAVEKDKVDRLVLFSQYPQYSCSTSGSSFNELYRFYKNRQFPVDMKVTVIDRWATNDVFVRTIASLIEETLKNVPEADRDTAMIIFSAHSLPLKAVQRGDSYPYEVGATVELVMKELRRPNPHQLVWQSKVGPMPWLGPATDEALKAILARNSNRKFLIVPIAFINEHIETLVELDKEYCAEINAIKKDTAFRVPAPNDNRLFIDALADIVKMYLRSNTSASGRFWEVCPHCDNKTCAEMKQWLKKLPVA